MGSVSDHYLNGAVSAAPSLGGKDLPTATKKIEEVAVGFGSKSLLFPLAAWFRSTSGSRRRERRPEESATGR